MFLPAVNQCKKCSEIKTADLFYADKRVKSGCRANCKDCNKATNKEWKEQNPERARQHWAKRNKKRYGMTIEEYEERLEIQNGVCAICKEKDASFELSIDHDHACCPESLKSCGLCVRGLLCGDCNRGLGLFKDNLEYLRAAMEYLEGWK